MTLHTYFTILTPNSSSSSIPNSWWPQEMIHEFIDCVSQVCINCVVTLKNVSSYSELCSYVCLFVGMSECSDFGIPKRASDTLEMEVQEVVSHMTGEPSPAPIISF